MPAKSRRRLPRLLVMLVALAAMFTGSPADAERLRIIPVPPNVVPQWTPMSDLPQMYYAPNLPTDVFRHRGRYYLYWAGAWYKSRKIKGPWMRMQRPPDILQSIQASYFKTLPRGGARSPGAAAPGEPSEGMLLTPEGKPAVPPPSLPSPPLAPVPPAPPSEAYAPSPPLPVPQEPVTPSMPGAEIQQPPLPPSLPQESAPPPETPKEVQPQEPDNQDLPDTQEPAPLAVPKGDVPKAM